MELPKFSNPRMAAEIEDWPFGRERCRARFVVEKDQRHGERVARYTENKRRNGWNAPKRTTYGEAVRIVDGEDERVYIIQLNRFGSINVIPGTLKGSHYVDKGSAHFEELRELFTAEAMQ